MHKKDLRSHMIKVHGAPKPHAVSDSWFYGQLGLRGEIILLQYPRKRKILNNIH